MPQTQESQKGAPPGFGSDNRLHLPSPPPETKAETSTLSHTPHCSSLQKVSALAPALSLSTVTIICHYSLFVHRAVYWPLMMCYGLCGTEEVQKWLKHHHSCLQGSIHSLLCSALSFSMAWETDLYRLITQAPWPSGLLIVSANRRCGRKLER